MKVFEHEHPLDLIDLEEKYAHDTEEESDDDENNDLAIVESFRCRCHRCGQEITQYHKYYYKCSQSCDYSIHKFCGELPPALEHPSHNAHPLILKKIYNIRTMLEEGFYMKSMFEEGYDRHKMFKKGYGVMRIFEEGYNKWRCGICRQNHHGNPEVSYGCSRCDFNVGINCVMIASEFIIHHPSHPHPLVPITRPILCECDACGKEHKGVFYHCTTCTNFCIHSDCVSLPKTLILKEATNDVFSHTHPLTLSYSFPDEDQDEKSYPRCRICDGRFDETTTLWIYKCDKCWFYTHVACATSKDLRKTHKNFEDANYLNLPFPYETFSMLKHISFKENGSQSTNDEGNLDHWSHQHPLTLVDTECSDHITKSSSSSSRRKLVHNPMKKIELLCNGCVRPITSTPFYMCVNEDESCNFALHEWCTRLPDQVQNHPGHPQHDTLVLLPKATHPLGLFECDVCGLECNGFVYTCVECGEYNTDVTCAFIPEKIRHDAHPEHLICRTLIPPSKRSCRSCLGVIRRDKFSFSCQDCNFGLHVGCALFLPQTIRHRFDKHPLKLSYLPIENHRSLYFCEVCEEQFDPKGWFYHCYECRQSIHRACAPLILECEKALYLEARIYRYVNIKFGGMHNIEVHPHPLSFVQGIPKDGHCHKCKEELFYKLILKCLQCTFAIDLDCFRSFTKSL